MFLYLPIVSFVSACHCFVFLLHVFTSRRALALSLALCNESNIRGMMTELLSFLSSADIDLKKNMVAELLTIAEK